MTDTRSRLTPGWFIATVGPFLIAGFSLTSCSARSVSCDSPDTTAAFRDAFATSGAPAAALVFAVAENNAEYAEMAFTAAASSPVVLTTIDAFARARSAALDVRNVVTKETKSSTAAMCQADVSFGQMPQGADPAAWKRAGEAHWTVEYTATQGESTRPSIGLGTSKCAGPACDVIAKYAPQVRDIVAQASTALKAAQKMANETTAVGVMRTIQIGQSVFSEDCAGGFFAPSLPVLAAAPDNFGSGFIPAEYRPSAGERLERSGYYFEISTEGPASPRATCNGYPAGTAKKGYTAIASPKDEASGSRHFMIDARGEIVQGKSKSGPWEPLK